MKLIFTTVLFCMVCSFSPADTDPLEHRIEILEKRIEKLENRLSGVLEQERVKELVKQQQARARERMMADADIFQRADLQIIEKLYQTANKDWRSEEARKSLKLLVERYPNANRTGCALLYLGQMSEGDEQLGYLTQAIERHGDCYYGNGVQVGPYATLYLAMRHVKDGNQKEAEKLFKEIRTNHPDAIDHKGQLLTSHIDQLTPVNPKSP